MAIRFGMPPGFQEALDRKYAIMRMTAEAGADKDKADASLTRTRAGLMPAESAAGIGLTRAQTGLAQANAANVTETTKFVKPLAEANVFNTRMQGSLYGQQAVGEGQLNKLSKGLMGGRSGGLPSIDDDFEERLKSILREGFGYSE